MVLNTPRYNAAIEALLGVGALRRDEAANALFANVGDHSDAPIRVRIGLHTGEAIKQESDFYGKNVVVAARIADRARGGEILASSVVKQLTESAGDIRFEQEREVELEGLAGQQLLYRVERP